MNVCVVDEYEIVREGLRAVLSRLPGISDVAGASSAATALAEIAHGPPDLVITEFRLPDATAGELCTRLGEAGVAARVVVLSAHLSEDIVQQCLMAGVWDFVTKSAGVDELCRAVTDALDGTRAPSPVTVSARLAELRSTAPRGEKGRLLSRRQAQVLELVAAGRTYGEISRVLAISESTVRFHVQGVKRLLGTPTTTEMVVAAAHAALVAPPPAT